MKARQWSKVHPNHNGRYRVTNWPSYDRSLAQRGSLTVWFSPEAIKTWTRMFERRLKAYRAMGYAAVPSSDRTDRVSQNRIALLPQSGRRESPRQ